MDLAPSSISRRVAILERQIGTRLLDRSRAGVELTHAGRLVSDFAGSVVNDYDALCADLNDLRGSRRQLIRVCGTASMIHMGPGSTLAGFRERFDSVIFRFDIVNTEEAVRLIKADLYDVGVTLRVDPDPDIMVMARVPEPTVLVVPHDHPFAGRSFVTMTDLADLPMALLNDDYSIRADFDRECRQAGIFPPVLVESSSISMLLEFVKNGMGATIMPSRTLEDKSLVPVMIDAGALRDNSIDVIVRRGRRLPRLVRLFAEALSEGLLHTAQEPGPALDLSLGPA